MIQKKLTEFFKPKPEAPKKPEKKFSKLRYVDEYYKIQVTK